MSSEARPGRVSRYAPAGVDSISNLEQVGVLADPFRILILETACEARTTKQVAGLVGEKPTRLDHHVEALDRVGLIRLVRTRRNRGTLEKYFQAVARIFRAAASLFPRPGPGSPEGGGPVRDVVRSLTKRSAAKLGRPVTDAEDAHELQDKGTLSFVEVHAGEKEIGEIGRRIDQLLESLQQRCGTRSGNRRIRMMIAFFPLDRPRPRK